MPLREASRRNLCKPRLLVESEFRLRFNKLKLLRTSWGDSAVQDNLDAKGRKVNVPGFDQRIQKGHTVFERHVEDIRVQELENRNPHFFEAAIAESGHQVKPVLAFQFLSARLS